MTKTLNWKAFALFAFLFAFIQPAQAADLIRLIVKEDRASCTGVAPQTCFQVKYTNSRNWELFYDNIGGFKYEEGYRYTLLVNRSRRANVPADASAYVYNLKSIVKKERIGAAKPAGIAAVADRQWQLSVMNGKKVPNSRISLYLDTKEKRFSGSDGCNTYFGSYSYNDRNKSISFGDAASTLKGCADREINRLASEYGKVLRKKNFSYKTDRQFLKLSYNGKVVLEFTLTPLTGNPGDGNGNGNGNGNEQSNIWNFIGKHQWRLIQMNGKTQNQSPAFINFDVAGNKVSGNAGCNRFFGTYTASGDKITFGSMGSTRMACSDQARSTLERNFLQLLNGRTFSFDVADQTLNLYQNNRLVLMFGMDNAAKQQGQGLRGTVNFMEGNLMPGTGPRTGTTKPVAREILIYEKTGPNQVQQEEGTFFSRISTRKVASVWSDNNGRYEVNLAPGTYSVFVKENGKLYANGSDGQGYINTVEVSDNTYTDFDIAINYKAVY